MSVRATEMDSADGRLVLIPNIVLIYYWIDTSQNDVFKAKDQGMVALKAAFDQAGIEIPYPIQGIYTVSGPTAQLPGVA